MDSGNSAAEGVESIKYELLSDSLFEDLDRATELLTEEERFRLAGDMTPEESLAELKGITPEEWEEDDHKMDALMVEQGIKDAVAQTAKSANTDRVE
mgnify:CR=1 FL=1